MMYSKFLNLWTCCFLTWIKFSKEHTFIKNVFIIIVVRLIVIVGTIYKKKNIIILKILRGFRYEFRTPIFKPHLISVIFSSILELFIQYIYSYDCSACLCSDGNTREEALGCISFCNAEGSNQDGIITRDELSVVFNSWNPVGQYTLRFPMLVDMRLMTIYRPHHEKWNCWCRAYYTYTFIYALWDGCRLPRLMWRQRMRS